MPEFFETRMGHTFYDHTMPRIADALEQIAKVINAEAPPTRAAVEVLATAATTPCPNCGGEQQRIDRLLDAYTAAPAATLRARGLPVPISLGLLDAVVDLLRDYDLAARATADCTSALHEQTVAVLARIEKEGRTS